MFYQTSKHHLSGERKISLSLPLSLSYFFVLLFTRSLTRLRKEREGRGRINVLLLDVERFNIRLGFFLVTVGEDKVGRERERRGSTNLSYAWRVYGKTRRGIPYEVLKPIVKECRKIYHSVCVVDSDPVYLTFCSSNGLKHERISSSSSSSRDEKCNCFPFEWMESTPCVDLKSNVLVVSPERERERDQFSS